MNSDLYESDILIWSEQEVALLRRVAAGERVNDQVDWEKVAEEIESVGRSELHAVESHLGLAFLHDLNAEAWPLSREVPHWRADARGQRADARRTLAPSMRPKIDVEDLYCDALRRLPETLGGQAPLPVQTECPFTSIDVLFTEPSLCPATNIVADCYAAILAGFCSAVDTGFPIGAAARPRGRE